MEIREYKAVDYSSWASGLAVNAADAMLLLSSSSSKPQETVLTRYYARTNTCCCHIHLLLNPAEATTRTHTHTHPHKHSSTVHPVPGGMFCSIKYFFAGLVGMCKGSNTDQAINIISQTEVRCGNLRILAGIPCP